MHLNVGIYLYKVAKFLLNAHHFDHIAYYFTV